MKRKNAQEPDHLTANHPSLFFFSAGPKLQMGCFLPNDTQLKSPIWPVLARCVFSPDAKRHYGDSREAQGWSLVGCVCACCGVCVQYREELVASRGVYARSNTPEKGKEAWMSGSSGG